MFFKTPVIGKTEFKIPVTNSLSIPSVMINGAAKGKRLVVTAGVHGCEYVGIEAVRQIIHELRPSEMKGSAIFVPLVNQSGFYKGAKQIVPEDGKNLNRVFPGCQNGTVSQQIADSVCKYLYPEADFILDLHGADCNEDIVPLVFCPSAARNMVNSMSFEVASSLSVEYVVLSKSNNGLYSYAAAFGIPSLLIERGGRGMISDGEVEMCKKNIREVMSALDIISLIDRTTTAKIIEKAEYIESEYDGFWCCSKKAGEHFKKGEILAHVENLFGDNLQTVYANFDGIVMYHTTFLGVSAGDPIIAYGEI